MSLYQRLLNKIHEEISKDECGTYEAEDKESSEESSESFEEASVAGAIATSALPLGARAEYPPEGRATRKIKYKNANSKPKKMSSLSKKALSNSNYPVPKKKSLIEALSFLFEAKTPRMEDLKKEHIVSLLKHMLRDTTEGYGFDITEKISGQAIHVGIKGTSKGNEVYTATKEGYDAAGQNIFRRRFYHSSGSSRHVKRAFMKYSKLASGEKKEFVMEVIKPDHKKPDYIAYKVPRGTIMIAVFKGDFSQQDASNLSGPVGGGIRLKFFTSEDIKKSPLDNMSQEVSDKVRSLITKVEEAPSRGFKSFVKREVSSELMSLVKEIYGGSILNSESPIEGVAINITTPDGETIFMKLPFQDYNELQAIQSSIYAEFKLKPNSYEGEYAISSAYASSYSGRAKLLHDYVKNPVGKVSFGYKVLKYVMFLNEKDVLHKNLRTFMSPRDFKKFCIILLQAIEEDNTKKYGEAMTYISKSASNSRHLYTVKEDDSFATPQSQALSDKIQQILA